MTPTAWGRWKHRHGGEWRTQNPEPAPHKLSDKVAKRSPAGRTAFCTRRRATGAAREGGGRPGWWPRREGGHGGKAAASHAVHTITSSSAPGFTTLAGRLPHIVHPPHSGTAHGHRTRKVPLRYPNRRQQTQRRSRGRQEPASEAPEGRAAGGDCSQPCWEGHRALCVCLNSQKCKQARVTLSAN